MRVDQEATVAIDVAVPSDSSVGKEEDEKLAKEQGLKEEVERV